jgi:hypothetical protein
MGKTLPFLLSGLNAVGHGLGAVCSAMPLTAFYNPPPDDTIFFRSDREALSYDWQCLCGDMQAVCKDMRQTVENVH